jgi:hypothetical protein
MIASEPKQFVSEGGTHWYTVSGSPCHEQPNKSKPGTMRPTTLKDARLQNLLPSVSSILAIQAKPGLNYWVKEQVAKAAFSYPYVDDVHSEEEYIDFVLSTAESNMSRARDLGSEIHGAIERFLKDDIARVTGYILREQEPYSLPIKAAVDALKELGVWGQPFRAERSFASPLGYGGCIDITDGKSWVFDFKCVDSLEKKLDYMDRCSQLTAYATGIKEDPVESEHWAVQRFRLGNIFISTSEPGKYLIREWSMEEKQRGWALFRACQNLFEITNNYFPSPPEQGRTQP